MFIVIVNFYQPHSKFLLALSAKLDYHSRMSLKFVQVPMEIISDIKVGKLIMNDLLTYTYLVNVNKMSGGKFILKTESEMASEIIVNAKPSSTSRVTKSLKRLREAGHITRVHSSRSSKTIINTKV
jgi:hypothetical protein